MRKSLLCASLIVSGLVGGTAAFHASAQPGHGHTPPPGLHGLHGHCELAAAFHAHLQQLHAELNLTDEQRDAVHAVIHARRAEIVGVVRPILEANRSIIRAVHSAPADEAAIRASADGLGRSVGDAAVLVARMKAEILQAAALTPEQTAKLDTIRTNVDASIGRMLDGLQQAAENPH